MHSLNDVSTIVEYPTYIFRINSGRKVWITVMTICFVRLSTYFLKSTNRSKHRPIPAVKRSSWSLTKNSSRMKNFAFVTSGGSFGTLCTEKSTTRSGQHGRWRVSGFRARRLTYRMCRREFDNGCIRERRPRFSIVRP